ncbi:MAG: carbohydrate kinase family protein [Ignavibacteriales bacterium]|nr:carbohydrate kinase family protein [Ignavibacteriales bacterium]
MKITLIGHFCVDVFHRTDGTEEKRFGGIYHAVAALSNIAAEKDTLFPVFGVGAQEIEDLKSLFSQLGNIDCSGIFELPGGSNIVHYYDDQPNERVENISPPIQFKAIREYLKVDGIYINMISGADITLETLDRIRLEVRTKRVPIHFDLHCLSLSINQDGTRFRRAMSDWRRWCFMTDSIQMNEEEAEGITLEHLNDDAFAKQMMPLMVKAFVVTRGKNGVTLFQEEHKILKRNDHMDGKNEQPVSEIGSGDIFGASFLYGYLKKKNYMDAVQFAQQAASHSTRFSISEKHKELRSFRGAI